jgi:hypothetical protein
MIRTGLPLIRVGHAAQEAYRGYGGSKPKPPPARTRAQHAARLDQIRKTGRQAAKGSSLRHKGLISSTTPVD